MSPESGTRKIYEFLTLGTQSTVTGGKLGMEIETDFVQDDGVTPISESTSRKILAGGDAGQLWEPKLELGRQKIELAVPPQPTSQLLFEAAYEGLDWLYKRARNVGGFPKPVPDFDYDGDLLWVQEERDEIWVSLDGRESLEELCRCSSIQFSVDK